MSSGLNPLARSVSRKSPSIQTSSKGSWVFPPPGTTKGMVRDSSSDVSRSTRWTGEFGNPSIEWYERYGDDPNNEDIPSGTSTGLVPLGFNKTVEIKSYGQGYYGRILGVVFVDGMNVNLEMVKQGLAEVYRGPPAKGLDLESYRKAENKARESKLNMWSLGDKYISPKEATTVS